MHLNERIAGHKVLTQPFQSQPLKGNKVEINRVCLTPVPTATAERELIDYTHGNSLGKAKCKEEPQRTGYRPDKGLLPPRTSCLAHAHTPSKLRASLKRLSYLSRKLQV